ncbi:class F sortase [Streptomyces liangshanensis]|uniref:Class F sortase n=1 Tax=Streptomyces liangshanensis TaxID=2717324 RepID=A0A6G9H7C3_9ACTN|nr:class F sortase [Streptomyces liangshanensis]QIQ05997.1 class F sortase [Streptomyces liangshanensis]
MTASLVTGVVWACGDAPADPPDTGPIVLAAPAAESAKGAGRPGRTAAAPRPPRPLPPSPPLRLAVPALTIEAPVTQVGLDPAGHLGTPPLEQPRVVGWYRGGPTPGEAGTALVVGHRDTRTGPAIFLNLNVLRPGDKVNIARADGRTAVFGVDAVKTYRKDKFPDREVYGRTGRPELRLLTCGGSFEKKTGYAANIVVFAHLTDVRRT